MLNEQWWRRACEESPYAICFVGLDDKFVWVNTAWEKLCGYPAAALVGVKRWQDITVAEDIGADQQSTEAIKNSEKDRYYDEKEYIGPLGDRRGVGLWVVKHPEFGPQGGYLVFGKPLDPGATYELAEAFAKLERDLLIVQQTQERFDGMEERISDLRRDVSDRIELISDNINALVTRGSSITVSGDQTHGDKTGGDKNSQTLLIVLGSVLVMFATLVLGGAIMFSKSGVRATSAPTPIQEIVIE